MNAVIWGDFKTSVPPFLPMPLFAASFNMELFFGHEYNICIILI